MKISIIKKNFVNFIFVSFFFFLVFVILLPGAKAQAGPSNPLQSGSASVSTPSTPNTRSEQTKAFYSQSGYSPSDAEASNIVGNIIKTALSLLGIVFLVLMIFSGYQWMTAGGNEEEVKKAKNRIKNAVIGLIIVVLAYAITAFVFKSLSGGGRQATPTEHT